MPSETYGRNGVTPIFRSFHRTASSTTAGWSRLKNVNVLFIHHSEHYGLIFRGYHIIIRSPLFSFCRHSNFYFRKYTLHVCYVFNVIWQIPLMIDDLNAVWSNDRAAPTDTNPKNLEFVPPQSVTAIRLDQLVYSPNCYIPIFQTHLFFPQWGSNPQPLARTKLKSNALTDCAIELCGWYLIVTCCWVCHWRDNRERLSRLCLLPVYLYFYHNTEHISTDRHLCLYFSLGSLLHL